MKSKLSILLILVFFVSCASGDKSAKKEMKEDAEFNWIENADFVPPAQVNFDISSDEYKDEVAEIDSLSRETLGKVPRPVLIDIAQDLDEPLAQAIGFCYQQNFKKAHQIFDGLYRKYKSHPGYWNLIGSCYLLEQKKRKALLFYNKAKDISPKFSAPLNNLGVIFQRDGYDQKALLAYQKAASLNPFSVTPKFNMAEIYLKYGIAQKAIPLYKEVLKRKEQDVDALSGLANAYFLNSNPKQAIYYFEKIDRDFWSRPSVGINFAYSLFLNRRVKDASSVLSKVDISQNKDWSEYFGKVRRLIK